MRRGAYPKIGRRITNSQGRGSWACFRQASSGIREPRLRWPEVESAEASMDRAAWLFTRVVLSAIGALATQGVNAQTTQDVTVCAGPRSAATADDRIAACTRVINSGQWRDKALGWAYNGRCLAQYDKRAWDEALSDCSMAIKLNPKDPYAYFNRGDT